MANAVQSTNLKQEKWSVKFVHSLNTIAFGSVGGEENEILFSFKFPLLFWNLVQAS